MQRVHPGWTSWTDEDVRRARSIPIPVPDSPDSDLRNDPDTPDDIHWSDFRAMLESHDVAQVERDLIEARDIISQNQGTAQGSSGG